MSRTPCFFVERYNRKTKQYELQHPIIWNYDHTKQVLADLFPYNGCHDLFSIVEEKDDCFPHMKGIHSGIPIDACKEIKEQLADDTIEESNNVYTPAVRWFTYADMYIYCLEHPTVTEYDEWSEEDKPEPIVKPTPMIKLKSRVNAFLEVMDDWGWEDDYSLIRIVYWIW